ncbi:hypothetical protein [uncultured Thiothrix sp.]|uniref:hypothetical protein n=1 Tax=uncultured Thiothrix sp. TaxID=223185 RepID=UPI002613D9A6|nr:hypothetical protein [uncultured Thiothrix sp.]
MKKIIHGALLAGAIPLVSGQAEAGPLAPIVNEANKLRATAWTLNDQATTLEQTMQSLKRQGIDVVELRYKAKMMRRCATKYAVESNKLAKKAFRLGYHRSNHSHPHYNS